MAASDPQPARERVNVAPSPRPEPAQGVVALRVYLHEFLLAVACLGIVTLIFVSISIAMDIHSLRLNHLQSEIEYRQGMFSRVDALLWKLDTFTSIVSATNKSLASNLTQLRAQVQLSTDSASKQTTAMTQATTSAMREAAQATTSAVQAVADKPASVVEVKADKPPIVIPVPEVRVVPADAPTPRPAPAQAPVRKRSRWQWLRYLWPGNWR